MNCVDIYQGWELEEPGTLIDVIRCLSCGFFEPSDINGSLTEETGFPIQEVYMDFLNAARKDDDELNLIMRDYEIFPDKMGPAGKSALNIAC